VSDRFSRTTQPPFPIQYGLVAVEVVHSKDYKTGDLVVVDM
jgi:hypothetical protein